MGKQQKSLSCFGHTTVDITDELTANTKAEIENAISEGVRIFMFGGRSDFDDLCYDIVSEIKQNQPELNLRRIFCFPLENHLRKPPWWYKKKEYEDKIYLVPKIEGWYRSIFFRNCAMVDESDTVLFFVENRKDSGAYKTYKYAKSRKSVKVINLFFQD